VSFSELENDTLNQAELNEIKIHVYFYSERFEFRHFRPHYLDVDTIFGDQGVNDYISRRKHRSKKYHIHFIITITDDPSPC
jgi:hypothetical protein